MEEETHQQSTATLPGPGSHAQSRSRENIFTVSTTSPKTELLALRVLKRKKWLSRAVRLTIDGGQLSVESQEGNARPKFCVLPRQVGA